MKHFFTLCFLAFCSHLIAQPTIISLSVAPPNPTVNDVITVYADCQFPIGGCLQDYAQHNMNGFDITATGHHCLGMLTVICSYTDTFEIGQLPQGTYTFDFTLTTGFGGPGCSPGIIPDDNDQLQFTVTSSVGIEEQILEGDFVFPNPSDGLIFFKRPISEPSILTNIQGEKVLEINPKTSQIDISKLPSGIYLLSSGYRKTRIIKN